MSDREQDRVLAVVAAIRQLPAGTARLVAQELAAAAQGEWLLVEEAAGIARVSQNTVRWWTQTRKLPASRAGRRLRIRRADLERFLQGGAS